MGTSNNVPILILFGISSFLLSLAWGYDCSNVLTKGSYGVSSYYGRVEFPAPHNFTGQWSLKAETDMQFSSIGGRSIWLTSDPEAGQVTFQPLSESPYKIHKGDLITFDIRIRWGRDEPEPHFISMIWGDKDGNGVEICQVDNNGIRRLVDKENLPNNPPAPTRRLKRSIADLKEIESRNISTDENASGTNTTLTLPIRRVYGFTRVVGRRRTRRDVSQ